MERHFRAPVASTLVLLSAVLLPACDGGSPSAPSPALSVEPVATPPPDPSPNVTRLVGVWNLAVRYTAVNGSGCVAETMRSQIGVANRYSLVITQKGNYSVSVTLRNASGDRACTFTPAVDDSGFTTFGQGGTYTCEKWHVDYHCNDGTLHGIGTFGENISGRVTGNAISGEWTASWFEGWIDSPSIETRAEFTGNRQN